MTQDMKLSPEEIERKPEREYWRGIPVIAYHWEKPSGFSPPSSTEVNMVAYHWSTGPQDAERLIRLSDAVATIEHLERERDKLAEGGFAWAVQAGKAERQRDAALEALKVANDAMAEYIRYLDGGETRGSYDGKPERWGLRAAYSKTRQALAQIDAITASNSPTEQQSRILHDALVKSFDSFVPPIEGDGK